jgi:hypothetical protein
MTLVLPLFLGALKYSSILVQKFLKGLNVFLLGLLVLEEIPLFEMNNSKELL